VRLETAVVVVLGCPGQIQKSIQRRDKRVASNPSHAVGHMGQVDQSRKGRRVPLTAFAADDIAAILETKTGAHRGRGWLAAQAARAMSRDRAEVNRQMRHGHALSYERQAPRNQRRIGSSGPARRQQTEPAGGRRALSGGRQPPEQTPRMTSETLQGTIRITVLGVALSHGSSLNSQSMEAGLTCSECLSPFLGQPLAKETNRQPAASGPRPRAENRRGECADGPVGRPPQGLPPCRPGEQSGGMGSNGTLGNPARLAVWTW